MSTTSSSTRLFTNLKGGSFLEPDEGRYYNLRTGRVVKNLPKDDGYMFCPKVRVVGTDDMINQFYTLNNLNPDQMENNTRTVALYETTPKTLTNKFTGLFSSKSSKYTLSSTNIHDIPLETLISLHEWYSMKGLFTPIRILRWKDGDTCVIAYHEPIQWGRETHEVKGETKMMCLADDNQVGCVKVMPARLLHVDAAEHDTAQGQEACRLMKAATAELNNCCYGYFDGWDLYGRILLEVYMDKNGKDLLNNRYLTYEHETLGRLFDTYGGGTKSTYMKNLPKIPRDQQTETS